MKTTTENVQKTLAAAVLALGAGATVVSPAVAMAEIGSDAEGASSIAAASTTGYEAFAAREDMASERVVAGAFSFTQVAVDPIEKIAASFGKAPAYLCGAQGGFEGERASGQADGAIAVGGAVAHAFTAPLDDLVERHGVSLVMGCACGGNPIDGRASASAEVEGVPIRALLAEAEVSDEANTIVFTSADGYEVALPLNYVLQRYSLIVRSVNGEAAESAVGGVNQLWLGSTSARYFARDIVSIELRCEQTPPDPPALTTVEASAVPNVAVTAGASL